MKKLRVSVLASGTGSNLKSLIEASRTGKMNAEIVLVISNSREAGALQIARDNDIEQMHLSREQYESDADLDRAFLSAFEKYQVDLIALAGYLKKISPAIIREYKNRILNIHPALLPSFGGKGMYGRRVHEAVLQYGCKVSGVTVHLIDDEYDTGPPVLQRCVPVEEHDTPETLAARVLKEEHKIYAAAVQLFAENRVEFRGRRVVIQPRQSHRG